MRVRHGPVWSALRIDRDGSCSFVVSAFSRLKARRVATGRHAPFAPRLAASTLQRKAPHSSGFGPALSAWRGTGTRCCERPATPQHHTRKAVACCRHSPTRPRAARSSPVGANRHGDIITGGTAAVTTTALNPARLTRRGARSNQTGNGHTRRERTGNERECPAPLPP